MKKIFTILFVSSLAIFSCKTKDTKENNLVGKWKPTELNLSGISEDERKEMLEHLTLEFTKDGKFTMTKKDSKQEGTYKYDKSSNKLVVTNNDSPENKYGRTQEFTIGWEGPKLIMTNSQGTVKLRRD